MYKLLIIDDEPLVQIGIRSMLNWDELGISICGVAGNGQAGWDILVKEQPDIVITDIKMPIMSGLDLIKKSRELYGYSHPVFILLTSYEEFQLAKDAITYQVLDYLVKLELTAATLKASITKAIDTLQSSTSASELADDSNLTQNDIQSLRDKFFIRLLHNLFDSPEQFELLKKDLDLPFDYPYFQCCYFEMSNAKADSLSFKQQISLYANSYQLLQEITKKYQQAYFVTLDRKHGVILFLYTQEELEHAKQNIQGNLMQISDTLVSYYNTSIRYGLGMPVTSPLSISDSYMNARQIFSETNKKDLSAEFSYSTNTSSKHTVFNLGILKNELSKALSEYDAITLHDALTQLTNLFEEHPDNYVQALDAACNILFLSISLLPHGEQCLQDLFCDVPDGYRSIYKQKTTSQVIAWILSFRDRMCNMFEEHKREHRHHVVDSVKKYIEAHLQDHLNLNEISALYGISPNYLSSLFKKYNDCGYSEYITIRKIAKAKEMMNLGSMKIYEISDALGFESAFYFSKVFKKVEGISPTEYINR